MNNVTAHITMPESAISKLFELLSAITAIVPGISVSIGDAPEAQSTVLSTVRTALVPEPAQRELEPWEVQLQLASPSVQKADRFEGRRKLYRVINPNLHLTGQPEQIKVYLLANGPQTARTLEQVLSMKRKSVESALTMLRAAQVVESYQP